MCGGSKPIKFFDLDGSQYDAWQQPLMTYDDMSILEQIKADPSPLVDEFAKVLNENIERYHSPLAFLSHPVSFAEYSRPIAGAPASGKTPSITEAD